MCRASYLPKSRVVTERKTTASSALAGQTQRTLRQQQTADHVFDPIERIAVGLDVYYGEATAIGEVEDQVFVTDSALTSTKYDIQPEGHSPVNSVY